VCIIRAFHSRRITFIAFYLGCAAVAFYIVYRMQSRGAVFGAGAALLFFLLVSSRMRRYALPFAVVAVVGLVLMETPEAASNRVSDYLMRGQSPEQFRSMTGRTETWELGLEAFTERPIFGRGQWADRLTFGQHSHNSFLQALLNGGLAGAIPYFGSWIAGWLLFFRLHKRRAHLAPQDRLSVLECGTVMMFFTVRAIPETTTASFAVDLLVMVAIYVYLETLSAVLSRGFAQRMVLVPAQTLSGQISGLPQAS
jgi:O-antigen ligase